MSAKCQTQIFEVLLRTVCAILMQNGHWSSFSIANQPVSLDSSQQSMPNCKMWFSALEMTAVSYVIWGMSANRIVR